MINKDAGLIFRKLSFIILLLLEVFIGWKNLQYIVGAEYNASEPVAEWERRFIRLKEAFPLTRGVVGYISDPDVAGYPYGPDDELEFNLTRWMRLAIGASYTVTTDIHFKNTLEPISKDALKGISGGVTIKFGKF